MLRALIPYLIVGSVISAGAGAVYATGGIGVPGLYAALLVAGLVTLVATRAGTSVTTRELRSARLSLGEGLARMTGTRPCGVS
jgi:hypothetical protein